MKPSATCGSGASDVRWIVESAAATSVAIISVISLPSERVAMRAESGSGEYERPDDERETLGTG